jgi:hypothetical protein
LQQKVISMSDKKSSEGQAPSRILIERRGMLVKGARATVVVAGMAALANAVAQTATKPPLTPPLSGASAPPKSMTPPAKSGTLPPPTSKPPV